MALETTACREALALAEDLHLHRIVIVSDTKQVIRDFQSGSRGSNGAIIVRLSYKHLLLIVFFLLKVVLSMSKHIV